MKKIYLQLAFLLTSTLVFSQNYSLEEVNLTPADFAGQYNTYMTDINNRGFASGYYTDSNGHDVGFVITRKGVLLEITQQQTGILNNRVVSINEHDVALVSSDDNGTTVLWKMYVADEAMTNLVQVNGLGQNPVTALKINNKNDISGWYQGVNSRWLFVLHDSIIPPAQPAWYASRYMVGPTWYNTWGVASDSNITAGFYLDAPNYYPFLHDQNNNTYQILTAPSKTKVWDMNSSHTMVGEYQQGNGTYMAFIGTVSGNTLNVNSLANIFLNITYQSVANGISENGTVVGNFYDPYTSSWKGFIYKPGVEKYRYNGWNFQQHSWKLLNSSTIDPSNTTTHWNKSFMDQYVNYNLFDNYLYNGDPLIDSFIKMKYCKTYFKNSLNPDWKSFAIEADKNYTPNGSAIDKLIYKYFKKYKLFDKYVKFIGKDTNGFEGNCYGFAITSMMYYADDSSIYKKFGVPMYAGLYTYFNDDSVCKRAIVRGQLQQFDPILKKKYLSKNSELITPWFGLYRTKTYMMDPQQYVNYRTLGLTLQFGDDYGGHAVFPYEIKTPKQLPFYDAANNIVNSDTVMIYDSNFPLDSSQFISIFAGRNLNYNLVYESSAYNLVFTEFNQPTFTELKNTTYAALKPTRSIDTTYDFALSPKTDFIIENGGKTTSFINHTYLDSIDNLDPMLGTGIKAFKPLFFMSDTTYSYHIKLLNYEDSTMSITQTIDDISMGISRVATSNQNDNLSIKNRMISYGNPENIAKNITCHFVQTHDGATQSVNLVAHNIALAANDSLITKNPYNYAYQIIHPAGADVNYDVDMYVLYTDSVKHFAAGPLVLAGNTSHLIDPYYIGPNGPQTVIYVDNGLNGTDDDTLFVPQVALNTIDVMKNAEYIKVYPNPLSQYLNIQVDQKQEEQYTIAISDLSGKIVRNVSMKLGGLSNKHTIDLNAIQSGTYLVFVFDKNNKMIFNQKIIKK